MSQYDYSDPATGESDGWVWGYGAKQESSEYIIHISGGGDGVNPNGFEDWVIKRIGDELKYYIRHGGNIPDKEQKGQKLFTCPEGNYVSFQEQNYEPREDEMDFEWLEDELEKTDFRFPSQIDNLTEIIEKLKEENEKLENMIGDSYSKHDIAHLTEENEKLKKENEKLEEGMNIMGGLQKGIDIDNKKLKEENKKLKEERQESMTILQEANCDIIGDIKKGLTREKLKKENKKLKEDLVKFKKINKSLAEQMKVKDDNWDLAMENEKKLKKEIERKDESIAFWEGKSEDKKDTIKELKEENKKLKEPLKPLTKINESDYVFEIRDNDKLYQVDKDDGTVTRDEDFAVVGKWNEKTGRIDFNEDKKDTIKELKEEIEYWRCWANWVDPNCKAECITKEHIDGWTTDPQKRAYLYEQCSLDTDDEDN
tara:strand:- start:43 stop:1320 length:1278 start_codon:yes stop_codon:yes gene_type:complete